MGSPELGVVTPDSQLEQSFEKSLSQKVKQAVVDSEIKKESLSEEEKETMIAELIGLFEAFALDLRSYNLAEKYVKSLFVKLEAEGAKSEVDFILGGAKEFYHLAKDTLGPLSVAYTHAVLKEGEGLMIFPARDATPYFVIAKTLISLQPGQYPVGIESLKNPFFNRKLWGVEDELDTEDKPLDVKSPLAWQFFQTMGFGKNIVKTFVEQGAWGSLPDMIKTHMPEERFKLYFFFSHLPEVIYGFVNQYGDFPEEVLETISDTYEALPKAFFRPTRLFSNNGVVDVSLEGKVIENPAIKIWSWAVFQGAADAAKEFALKGKNLDVTSQIEKVWQLSQRTEKEGVFTGVLPQHTLTWTEGAAWRVNWPWGKIPPLK